MKLYAFAATALLAVTACYAIEPAQVPVSDPLERCRNEARDTMADGGSVGESVDAYERCKQREGI